MGDHWLPALVQRRFATSAERVRVRRRNLSGNTYVTGVANNFQQNHFNTLNVPGIEPDAAERALAVDIEGPGAAAIAALMGVLGGGKFSREHKAALSVLMAMQLTRHPNWRTTVGDFMSQIMQFSVKARADIGQSVVVDGQVIATAEQLTEAAALLEQGELTIAVPNEFHVLNSFHVTPELVQFFFRGSWCLLTSDTPWFVLPDSWVILERPAEPDPFNGVGLLTSNRYVIPLDPFTCLEIEPLHARHGKPPSPRVEVRDLPDLDAMHLAVLLLEETIEQFAEHPDLPTSATLERIQTLYRSDPGRLCHHTGQAIAAARIELDDAVANATWCVIPPQVHDIALAGQGR